MKLKIPISRKEQRKLYAKYARSLRDKGYTLQEIADIMGYKNHNSITHLLKDTK